MNFSNDWKSIFPVGSVYSGCCPLLLTNADTNSSSSSSAAACASSTSSTPLGPLFFTPNPNTATTLFTSPSLSPPLLCPPNHTLSLERFLCYATTPHSPILPSTAFSIASSFATPHQSDPASFLTHNRLQLLTLPHNDAVTVFFSTGSNHDLVGFLLVRVRDKSLVALGGPNDTVLTAKYPLRQRIERILVNPLVGGSGGTTIGYLLVYTLYSVHWFRVKVSGDQINEKPVLDYVGRKLFKTCAIAGACWSPHLPEESVVLLEDGSLFLFDVESDCGVSTQYFRGTRVKVSWDIGVGGKWLGCEFSWHPRILVVARSDSVFSVDWKEGKCKLTCLANIRMLQGIYRSVENDHFLAFSKAVSDNFHFVLVSCGSLILCDLRKPLAPLLQWTHGLDKPFCVDVFRLSELRSNSRDDPHEGATSSGFGIVLGSFWNCEFSIFCYGPPLPACRGSIASSIAEVCKTFYAWELPSDLLLLGNKCPCGSCLLREDFRKESTPSWHQKQVKVLGFGILSKGLSSLLFEPDEFGGFTLIRLMSSGKLESQRYCASWNSVRKLGASHRKSLSFTEDNLLYDMGDEEGCQFPRRFRYLKFDYLRAYLRGNLSEILHQNMYKPYIEKKDSSSLNIHKALCEKLKILGLGQLRTATATDFVFNDIHLPTSVHELALRKIWASLPMELLQLAFSTKVPSFEFLPVPDMPQLPPFFLRKPSNRSSNASQNLRSKNSPFGPVLPLPVLITMHEFRNGCHYSQKEMGAFSPEVELGSQCNEVMQVARKMSTAELPNDDEDDIQVNSGNHKSFFLHHPAAGDNMIGGQKDANYGHVDESHAFMVSKVRKKEPAPTRSDRRKAVGQELFDDLCPIHLKFNASAVNFSSKELKAYKLLKNQFSKWQSGFSPYQEFLSQLPSQKKHS